MDESCNWSFESCNNVIDLGMFDVRGGKKIHERLKKSVFEYVQVIRKLCGLRGEVAGRNSPLQPIKVATTT